MSTLLRSRFTLGLTAALCTLSARAGDPLDLGSRRELFVDRTLIETTQGTRLQLHAPQPQEQVLSTDLPWEGVYCAYFTVIPELLT